MSLSVRHQVAHGTMLLAGARILSRSFDFMALIVLARHLTPADFGLVAIALSVVQIAEAMLEVPTGIALLQLRSVGRSHLNSAFTIALIRGVAIAVGLGILSVPLAHFFSDERLTPLICALALAPAIRALRSPKEFLLFKQLRFWPDAAAEVFGKFCALIVAVTVAVQTDSYWAIASATIAGPVFYVLATYVMVPMRPRLTVEHFGFFYSFLGWSMAAQTMSAANWQADRFVLGKLATQATVGLFATARDLAATIYKAMMEAMQRPLMAALSRSNGNPARQRQVYGISLASILSIGLPIACAQAILAPDLIELILGPQWLPATIVFQAVSLAFIPGMYSYITLTLLYAVGKPRLIFTRNLYDFVVRVPLIIACIFAFGWLGAVLALVIADLFLAALCIVLAKRVLGIGIVEQLARAGRGLLSAGVMTVVLVWLSQTIHRGEGELGILLYLGQIVPVGAAIYCFVHWTIWRMAGRPDGVEALVIHLIDTLPARPRKTFASLHQKAADRP